MMDIPRPIQRRVVIAIAVLLLGAGGCVSRPPTIAHVHLGHALTGVHVTPNREGYLLVGEKQAQLAYKLAQEVGGSTSLEQLKTQIASVVQATSSQNEFGLKQSVILASNHISFAATSADASINVQQAAPVFAKDIARVVERCELITLLGKDVAASKTKEEAAIISEEILKLSKANVEGEDTDGDGKLGSTPGEYGMAQLRSEFDTIITRERPPYHTVDQWYLFNLVRLPNGRWVFDKLGRGGNIDGYK